LLAETEADRRKLLLRDGLGQPIRTEKAGFAHLRARRRRNPAEILFEALNQPDLDARVADGLPWLVMTYVDMDWDWLVRNPKVRDRQNRLEFAVSLAADVAEGKNDKERARELRQSLEVLEGARLARGSPRSQADQSHGLDPAASVAFRYIGAAVVRPVCSMCRHAMRALISSCCCRALTNGA